MVQIEVLNEKISRYVGDNGKLVHLHNLGLDEDVKVTYIVIYGPSEREVYDVLRSMRVRGMIQGGNFIGKYMGDTVVCGESCPTMDIIWKYKTWIAKWEEDEDYEGEGTRYVCNGKIIYRDRLNDIKSEASIGMRYVRDDDIWKVDFMIGGGQFKFLKFKSTSERYGKTKMLEVAENAFPLQFYLSDVFENIYGSIVVNQLYDDKMLVDF